MLEISGDNIPDGENCKCKGPEAGQAGYKTTYSKHPQALDSYTPNISEWSHLLFLQEDSLDPQYFQMRVAPNGAEEAKEEGSVPGSERPRTQGRGRPSTPHPLK